MNSEPRSDIPGAFDMGPLDINASQQPWPWEDPELGADERRIFREIYDSLLGKIAVDHAQVLTRQLYHCATPGPIQDAMSTVKEHLDHYNYHLTDLDSDMFCLTAYIAARLLEYNVHEVIRRQLVTASGDSRGGSAQATAAQDVNATEPFQQDVVHSEDIEQSQNTPHSDLEFEDRLTSMPDYLGDSNDTSAGSLDLRAVPGPGTTAQNMNAYATHPTQEEVPSEDIAQSRNEVMTTPQSDFESLTSSSFQLIYSADGFTSEPDPEHVHPDASDLTMDIDHDHTSVGPASYSRPSSLKAGRSGFLQEEFSRLEARGTTHPDAEPSGWLQTSKPEGHSIREQHTGVSRKELSAESAGVSPKTYDSQVVTRSNPPRNVNPAKSAHINVINPDDEEDGNQDGGNYQNEWPVDHIIAEKPSGSGASVLVVWRGYGPDEDQWRPKSELEQNKALDDWEQLTQDERTAQYALRKLNAEQRGVQWPPKHLKGGKGNRKKT